MGQDLKSGPIKGWKCFDERLCCRGMQFEVGKVFEAAGELKLCSNGIHFHEKPEDVFKYYDKDSRLCEVEAVNVITDNNKSVCSSIKVIREITGIEKYFYGYGYGDGSGSGYGDGYGSGYGSGSGYGYGDSYGDGYGYGSCYGYGYGDGSGYGYGYGDGYGYGYGYGLIFSRSFRKLAA